MGPKRGSKATEHGEGVCVCVGGGGSTVERFLKLCVSK